MGRLPGRGRVRLLWEAQHRGTRERLHLQALSGAGCTGRLRLSPGGGSAGWAGRTPVPPARLSSGSTWRARAAGPGDETLRPQQRLSSRDPVGVRGGGSSAREELPRWLEGPVLTGWPTPHRGDPRRRRADCARGPPVPAAGARRSGGPRAQRSPDAAGREGMSGGPARYRRLKSADLAGWLPPGGERHRCPEQGVPGRRPPARARPAAPAHLGPAGASGPGHSRASLWPPGVLGSGLCKWLLINR